MFTRIRNLFRDQAIYGLGTVATSIVGFLLLPFFTRYLTQADYGILLLLAPIEAVIKVLFRWGIDTAFMRFYYDCADQRARQRLASTIFLFLFVTDGALVAAGVLGAGRLSTWIFGDARYAALVAWTIVNTFVGSFYFMPFHVMRIQERSRQFMALTFVQSVATIIARIGFVMGLGLHVYGVVMADVAVTTLFTLLLLPWFLPLIRPMFSRSLMRDALAFGLPRIPHSLAQQVIGYSDRFFLDRAGYSLGYLGLYSVGSALGSVLKYFVSAFETAWTPFFLGAMREPDAARTYSAVGTYVSALLALLLAGVCATGPDAMRLATAKQFFTSPTDFHTAAMVIPWIACGAAFQGLYVLVSIGLVIKKRTMAYPIATGIAAAVAIGANLLLTGHFGGLGASLSNALAYGTLTVVTGAFSLSVYPIRYEWSRLIRIVAAGLASYGCSRLVPVADGTWLAFLLHGTTVVVIFGAVLGASGFFHAGELARLKAARRRAMSGRVTPAPASEAVQVGMGEIIDAPLDAGRESVDVAGRDADAADRGARPASPDSPGRRR